MTADLIIKNEDEGYCTICKTDILIEDWEDHYTTTHS